MKLLGIELTYEEFDNLMCEQAKGKELKVVNNKVVAVEPVITEQDRLAEYENKIVCLIREKYNINQELAILRQKDTKATEYNEYYDYVEECKSKVKNGLI